MDYVIHWRTQDSTNLYWCESINEEGRRGIRKSSFDNNRCNNWPNLIMRKQTSLTWGGSHNMTGLHSLQECQGHKRQRPEGHPGLSGTKEKWHWVWRVTLHWVLVQKSTIFSRSKGHWWDNRQNLNKVRQLDNSSITPFPASDNYKQLERVHLP